MRVVRTSITHLYVYRAGGDVADEQVDERVLPRPTALEHGAEPGVEEAEPGDLGPPPPAASSVLLGLERGLGEIAVRVGVEVEAGEGEDDVEELVLEGNEELASGVEGQLALVVRGPEGLQEDGGDGEEGEVLDVGVAIIYVSECPGLKDLSTY